MFSVNPDQNPEQKGSGSTAPEKRPPLVVILGPTAVGKTEIAIQLAIRLNGEIISADSRLFYRGMDIGTAKPALSERQRVPHHLIDIAEPDETISLADFQHTARLAISAIHSRGHLAFLVGGTGQYIRATTQAWELPKVYPNTGLREVLESWSRQVSPEGLHRRLASLDPVAAARINPGNLRRTVRALEVIFTTGARFSDQSTQQPSPYQLLLLGLIRPRAELYQRIDARLESMLAAGFIDEVRSLIVQGYPPDLPAFSAIGYHELIAYLQGKLTLDEAVARIKRQTRIFVRRQANWFKADDPTIHWFQVNSDTVDQMESVIRLWLKRKLDSNAGMR